MTMNKIEIYMVTTEEKERLSEKISAILAKEKRIVFACLYGSFLTEPFFRDIDIGIFVKGLPSRCYFDYEFELSQKIKGSLKVPFEIDVRVINTAPLSFRFHVIRGKVIHCTDIDITDNYIMNTAREYLDIAPLRHRYILET